jgi:hypothetical protein
MALDGLGPLVSFAIGWNALVVSMAIWNRQFELALAESASFALRGDVRAKPEEEEQEVDTVAADGWHIGRHEAHPGLRLLASVLLRPQRQKDKRDKVVLSDLAVYRKPWRDWPLPTWPERELEPRTDPVTATELANKSEYYLDHSCALYRLQALSRVEELIEESWDEYRDSVAV